MVTITKLSNKTHEEAMEFYRSHEWRSCRRVFLKNNLERVCTYCKVQLDEHNKLNVDHIKPLRYYWDLRLDHTNLQIVCENCNKEKRSWSSPEQARKNWWVLNVGSGVPSAKYGKDPKTIYNKKYYKYLYNKKIH